MNIKTGDVFMLGQRRVFVPGQPGRPPARNWRGAVAVRNVATNRLTYVAESRLGTAITVNAGATTLEVGATESAQESSSLAPPAPERRAP